MTRIRDEVLNLNSVILLIHYYHSREVDVEFFDDFKEAEDWLETGGWLDGEDHQFTLTLIDNRQPGGQNDRHGETTRCLDRRGKNGRPLSEYF